MAGPLTGAERQARYRRRHPERIARSNATRVWVGRIYVGMTHTPETSAMINDAVRKEQRDRKKQS